MKTSFRQYAELKGIDLMREDIKFLKAKLLKIPTYQKRSFLEKYVEEWLQGMQETNIIYQKQNHGRRRGNSWLREIEQSEEKL